MTEVLTKDAVPKMAPGPEMDRLVDWRIMGRRGLVHVPVPVPAYSTDIAAAWGVAEWLRGQGERCKRQGDGDDGACFAVEWCKSDGCWLAGFRISYDYEGDGWSWNVAGDTAPLAICRAALLTTFPQ